MACIPFVSEDSSLDDAELWDFIDNTVARQGPCKPHTKPLLIAHHTIKPPTVIEFPPLPQISSGASSDPQQLSRFHKSQKRQAFPSKPDYDDQPKPLRACPPPSFRMDSAPENSNSPAAVEKQTWFQPHKMARRREEFASPSSKADSVDEPHDMMQRPYVLNRCPLNQIVPHESNNNSSHDLVEHPRNAKGYHDNYENRVMPGNELMPNVPSASMFKHIQSAALNILEKGDYVMMQGKPFIKKSGWRKIAFFFNVSFEIKDRTIQFDANNNVQRAEFVVRANMQCGRYSDGWGSCDRGEKRFSKPNHDIPSTAETRAKTRACQDLLGIGEYKSGSTGW